ncbi:MAG TPA: ATP-binding protein [Candidatus Sulfotelmatobacter sp.]|jgi:signal transduction histidine kinase
MLSLRDCSIPKKLTWINMVVSGTALLLAGAGLFAYDLYSFRAGTVRDLGIQAQIIGSNSISAVMFDDPHSAETTLSALRAAPHVMSAEIYTLDGSEFAGYRRDRGQAPSLQPTIPNGQTQASRIQNGQVALVRLIMFHGKPVATVYLRSDLEAINARERGSALIVATVFLMALLAAMWMSASARRSIADPIVRLAETAQIVLSEKNYSVRAPANGERNEIGVLISTFNEMLAQIQERDAAIGEAHDRLEQQVQERTAQLHAANGDLEAFSYSVSHDLRAPLRHISGFSQILSEEYGSKMEPEAQQYLNRIQSGVKSMGRLIEDLLKMAQIGREHLVRVNTDLNSLLRDVLSDLQSECGSRQIDWQIGDLSPVECDPGLMKQVFTNLLSNAVKYSRRREIAVIEVGQIQEKGVSVIFVRDNGAGFDERYANKLFGVFQRLHKAEDFEGTGVGLSTVRRIVRKHGGEVWAKSEVGKGATFFFALVARPGLIEVGKAAVTGR